MGKQIEQYGHTSIPKINSDGMFVPSYVYLVEKWYTKIWVSLTAWSVTITLYLIQLFVFGVHINGLWQLPIILVSATPSVLLTWLKVKAWRAKKMLYFQAGSATYKGLRSWLAQRYGISVYHRTLNDMAAELSSYPWRRLGFRDIRNVKYHLGQAGDDSGYLGYYVFKLKKDVKTKKLVGVEAPLKPVQKKTEPQALPKTEENSHLNLLHKPDLTLFVNISKNLAILRNQTTTPENEHKCSQLIVELKELLVRIERLVKLEGLTDEVHQEIHEILTTSYQETQELLEEERSKVRRDITIQKSFLSTKHPQRLDLN